ncbi:transmembrane protein, putative [Bodo saltans]|uniref:Transmembrane protein, putative n=1 Tax=Bodo saltans TaxID=75058 RepID=A0A0S4IQN6_BODSA|nr:transmembrane protein, putative [Bodo saltans]|eukprot:CUF26929.1 transmembrane protein, putative [Bodo saltans]
MGFNNPFTRGVVQRLMNDPNVRNAVNKVKNQVQKHPATQKFINDVKSKFKAGGTAAASPAANGSNNNNNNSQSGSGSHHHNQQQTGAGAKATPGDFFSRGQKYWEQHRERVIAFVAANFMGILFFIQFGQQLWHLAVATWSSMNQPHAVEYDRKKKKARDQQSQAQRQPSVTPVPTPQVRPTGGALSLNIDDEPVIGGGGSVSLGALYNGDSLTAFDDSFGVKMGDSKEFQPALDSAFVTGDTTAISKGLFASLVSSGESSEELVFDMRYQSNMSTKL